MTNEELEQEVKRLEEQIKDLKVKLGEKVEKKPYEVEVPEDIEDYYYVDGYGHINSLKGFGITFMHSHYQRGLAFKTREEAEQFDKERILTNKAKDWAKKYNVNWTPEWEDFDEEKRSIYYDIEYKKFKSFKGYKYKEFFKLPYLKSEELAEQFIKEFGDEIKEVLC